MDVYPAVSGGGAGRFADAAGRTAPGVSFPHCFRQRNRLGFLLALAGTLFFSLQIVWYIGMNIGICPVTAAYMPFYTLGGSYLCVTCLYAGILLSVYRNSSVVRC